MIRRRCAKLVQGGFEVKKSSPSTQQQIGLDRIMDSRIILKSAVLTTDSMHTFLRCLRSFAAKLIPVIGNHLSKARSTFSPAFSSGPFGSTAFFTSSTVLSIRSPAFSAGPFCRQDTAKASNGNRHKDNSNVVFMETNLRRVKAFPQWGVTLPTRIKLVA